MKKLVISFSFFATSLFSFAGVDEKYKVNDAVIDRMFAQSTDVSYELQDGSISLTSLFSAESQSSGEGGSVGGFLVRNCFCGFIGLHRTYMGSNFGDMWWKYCLVTILVGGIPQTVDFCWVLFDGEKALSKYRGNNKFLVWLE